MISVDKATMTYKSGKGIFDVSFQVKEGEVFGYLGPNGAGKTTTIRLLMGFTNPDSGGCTIRGLDCRRAAPEIQKFVGYLPGEMAFFEEMTGKQFLRAMNEMRGIKNNSRTQQLLERLELDCSGRIRKMSKGMKQKLGIVAAFQHDPSVYILDEPTSGLDPLMQQVFIEMALEERDRGKTILMSSHNFEEIERTCDRAGVIREGRLAAVEDIHSLREARRRIYSVTLGSEKDVETLKASGLELRAVEETRVEVVIGSNYDDFIKALGKCRVLGLDVVSQTLEQVFMQYYGEVTQRERNAV